MSQSQVQVNYKNTTDGKNFPVTEIFWSVPNFIDLLGIKQTRELRVAAGTKGLQLKMQFLGNNNDIIEIYYCHPSLVVLDITIEILNNKPKPNLQWPHMMETRYTVHHTNQQPYMWNYIHTILKKEYFIEKYSQVDKALKLKLDFVFHFNGNENKCLVPAKPAKQLTLDLKNSLKDEKFSDVVMKSVDGKEFKVHKVILASRSAVLKALFEHNSIEQQTNVIESPFQSEVLVEVINFIYTDEIFIFLNRSELLAAADYYQLASLKRICEDSIIETLSQDTVLEFLQTAELYSANYLKQACFNFIKNQGLNGIIKSEIWSKFDNVQLLKGILEKLATVD